jgi:hypothetical protein
VFIYLCHRSLMRIRLAQFMPRLEHLNERRRAIVDIIGNQDSEGPNGIPAPAPPSDYSVQRKVVAMFAKKQDGQPHSIDFRYTLGEKLHNVIDVSLDECRIPLQINNVKAGRNDNIYLGTVLEFSVNSCTYDAVASTFTMTVQTTGMKDMEEYATAAAAVYASVSPAGAPLGVRIALHYDMCVLLRYPNLVVGVFKDMDTVLLQWGRCAEESTIAFTKVAQSADGDTMGIALYLSSKNRLTQASTIGAAKRQSEFNGVASPVDVLVGHHGKTYAVRAADIVSVELNHIDATSADAGIPNLAASEKGGSSQVVSRLSDYLIMLPVRENTPRCQAPPPIGTVFTKETADGGHEPQATLVDMTYNRQGNRHLILRPCYINTDNLSSVALYVDDTQWTAAGCMAQGVLGVTTDGSLPNVGVGEFVAIGTRTYECTGELGVAYALYVYARRSGNPGPLYYDTLLDRDVSYSGTDVTIRNEINGHPCHCGTYAYQAVTANAIGSCHRSIECHIRVEVGFYAAQQYASAVSRSVNDILLALDIGRVDTTAMFAIVFSMDGNAISQLSVRTNSCVKSIHYRKGVPCKILGLGTERSAVAIGLGRAFTHPDIPDASAGADNRIVHIRIRELEGNLHPRDTPWRSFVTSGTESSLVYTSMRHENPFVSAHAAQFHNATKRTLVELSTLTFQFTTGSGSPLPYAPPGAVLLVNVSYLHAALPGDGGPTVVL